VGSIAAGIQSGIGAVFAGSAFAAAQSAGAAGVSAATAYVVGGITLATGAGAGAGAAAMLILNPCLIFSIFRSSDQANADTYVKAIALPGELTIHIFRMDQKFFLSSIEMPRIIPDCHGEGAVASLSFAKLLTVKSLSVQSKVITQIREHHVFDDCVTSNVPWIEENGVVREYIELYSLDEILPLLFCLGATAEIISVIQREMKNYDE